MILHYRRFLYINEQKGSEGSYAVIFASDFMLQKMKDVEQIQFDETFYTVPSIFYQLFTIFITFHGHCIPVVNILMQNKTENLYTVNIR